MEPIQFVSAILLATPDPQGLAQWYIDILGLPLIERTREGGHRQFDCMLGTIHFGIHQSEEPQAGGAIDLAFHVFDISAAVRGVIAKGIMLDQPITNHGFAHLAAIKDPIGNRIWLSQVTPGMVQTFEEQRASGHDVATIARSKGIAPD